MDISGKIIQLLGVQTGQGKNGPWKKQEFILETGDAYPKKVCIAVWGEKIDMSQFRPGDPVQVSFDVESREYNGKWYTDVKAWKVVGQGNTEGPAPAYNGPIDAMPEDDLPF
ncbi:DUF3127 domain-containing protein [Flavihumibacter profundi]|jgi:hypothetical protein|uniref:DUF3127 domain-containing protein n=1 Tax=Flavihumibacter profundi TaxID=2716883 RepID=UPI001CC5878B|nr:DUF3127 domain-containing protein [Flavihumibacter profundi]MBZ5857497.1 DUF3127 domain-containing protein [Flavihumibacter profundi]